MQPSIYVALKKNESCRFENVKIAHSGKNEESFIINIKEMIITLIKF